MRYFLIIFSLLASCGKTVKTEAPVTEKVTRVEIAIKGMSCTGCEETITKSTLTIDGVTEARASFKEGKAWIAFDSARVTPQQISTSIQSKGYEVTGISFTVEDGSQPTDGDHESGV